MFILKFNTGNGPGDWAFHQATRVNVCGETTTLGEALKADGFVYASPEDSPGDSKTKLKQLSYEDEKGIMQTVFYGRCAYLCNDRGDTINSL